MSPLRDRGERASVQIAWQSDTPHSERLRCLARAMDLLKRNAICLDRKRTIQRVGKSMCFSTCCLSLSFILKVPHNYLDGSMTWT